MSNNSCVSSTLENISFPSHPSSLYHNKFYDTQHATSLCHQNKNKKNKNKNKNKNKSIIENFNVDLSLNNKYFVFLLVFTLFVLLFVGYYIYNKSSDNFLDIFSENTNNILNGGDKSLIQDFIESL